MQLLLETINKGGYFEYQHIENDICGEIAIVLDEDAEIIKELSRQQKRKRETRSVTM